MKYLIIALTLILIYNNTLAQNKPVGLSVDTEAPNFKAKNQLGMKINLKKELKKGPVVVVFYRGQWCPYCNKQLKALEDSLSFLTAKNASLIAVTPEKPENINKTVEKTKATYSILYDKGLKIMKAYDVAFAVDEATIEKYKKYGIDFEKANGENGANLPVPAVFIINKQGKIIYRFFDTDYSKRPSISELLSHL
jgi:peroxiredoxin